MQPQSLSNYMLNAYHISMALVLVWIGMWHLYGLACGTYMAWHTALLRFVLYLFSESSSVDSQ